MRTGKININPPEPRMHKKEAEEGVRRLPLGCAARIRDCGRFLGKTCSEQKARQFVYWELDTRQLVNSTQTNPQRVKSPRAFPAMHTSKCRRLNLFSEEENYRKSSSRSLCKASVALYAFRNAFAWISARLNNLLFAWLSPPHGSPHEYSRCSSPCACSCCLRWDLFSQVCWLLHHKVHEKFFSTRERRQKGRRSFAAGVNLE